MAGPRTVQLAQLTERHAELVVAALERAGIVWWHKTAGGLTRWLSAGDWGVRVFVEHDRLEEARQVAAEALAGEREG